MIACLNVSIIGKPNVGKSTIFNKIAGSNISKVSEVSGTTIFPIELSEKFKDLKINLIDLGGLKKKSKSHEKTQKLITSETLKKLKLSDVVLFILDGSDQITKNDKQLFRLILNKLKNIIVIVNKTDLIKENLKKKEEYFKFFFEKNFPNILLKPIFISALKNIKREFLLNKLYDIYNNLHGICGQIEGNCGAVSCECPKRAQDAVRRRKTRKGYTRAETNCMIFIIIQKN